MSAPIEGGPLSRWLLPVARGFERVAIVLLVTATSLIMLEVVARGVFNTGLAWAGELARFSGLGVIFLTVPLLLAGNGHVRVDLFLNLLPAGARRVADFLGEILVLLFCALFLASCWWFMQRAGRFSTPALAIPNLVYYAPAIAGMVLTTAVAVDRVIGMTGRLLRPDGDSQRTA